MAVTRYEVFCRYFNDKVNRCATNQTEVEWVGREKWLDLSAFYAANRTAYQQLCNDLTRPTNARRRKDFSITEENIYSQCELYEKYMKLQADDMLSKEICQIQPLIHVNRQTPQESTAARQYKSNRDLENWGIIIDEMNINNPKYDMIFMYDGIFRYDDDPNCDSRYHETDAEGCKHQKPYIYADRFKRIPFDIWFLNSVHASLASAMTKANTLVNVVGKDSIKIGKVVPLDKYIDIV